MILFDIKEGSTDSIGSKCYIEPGTKLVSESIARESSIEVVCEGKSECKNKKCPEPFDITTEIIYEPYKILR